MLIVIHQDEIPAGADAGKAQALRRDQRRIGMAVAPAFDPLHGLSYGWAEPDDCRFNSHSRGAGQAAAWLFVHLWRDPDHWWYWCHRWRLARQPDTKKVLVRAGDYQHGLDSGPVVAIVCCSSEPDLPGRHFSADLYYWSSL